MLGFSVRLVLTLASFLLLPFVSSALLPRTSADSISSQYGLTPDSTALRIPSSNNVTVSQDGGALDTNGAAKPPPGLTFEVRFQEVPIKRLQAEALFVATMVHLAGLNQKAQVRGGPYTGTEYPDVLLSVGPAPGQHFEVEHLLWAIRWLHHEQFIQRVASWTSAVIDLHMNGVRIGFVGIIPIERLQTLPGSQNVSNAAINTNHSSVTTIPSFSKRVNAADPIGQNDTFSHRQLKVSVEYKSRVDLNELILYLMYSTIILRLVYMQDFSPNKGWKLEDPILHIACSMVPQYPPRTKTPTLTRLDIIKTVGGIALHTYTYRRFDEVYGETLVDSKSLAIVLFDHLP